MSAPVAVQHVRSSPFRNAGDVCRFRDGCFVTEDGWAECGERACPECGSPAVHVTALADGTEHISCECGEVWRS